MKYFERYRLIEEVGSGTTGTVYLAFDPAIGRRVALKIVDAGWWGPTRKGRRGRLLHEAHVAGSLLHPNIVAVYDVVEHPRKVGLVLEFIAGESLRARLDRSGPLPVADALAIATQMAAALSHAHARGIVHGDVKPANILMADPGRRN
jgi:serine/threonine protein kinase